MCLPISRWAVVVRVWVTDAAFLVMVSLWRLVLVILLLLVLMLCRSYVRMDLMRLLLAVS